MTERTNTIAGQRTRRILVAMTWEEEGQVLGVLRYAQHAGWSVRVAGPLDHTFAADWAPDGIICQLCGNNPSLIEAVTAAGVPTVELQSYLPSMKVPRVLNNGPAAGRAAAEHYIDRNFRRLVDVGWSRARTRAIDGSVGFTAVADAHHVPVQQVNLDDTTYWQSMGVATPALGLTWEFYPQGAEALVRHLMQNKEPAAVFSQETQFALSLVNTATELGIHIPEQLAVLTLVTRPHENELASIPVSCIHWNFPAQGYLAAETLDRLFQGETVPEIQQVDPYPVAILESSDTHSTRNLRAALAIKHFRDNALNYHFSPATAAEELGTSLRTLHRWFTAVTGTSPAEYIETRRLQKAMELLKGSRISVEQAARISGFSEHRQLRRALRRHLDTTPQSLRATE